MNGDYIRSELTIIANKIPVDRSLYDSQTLAEDALNYIYTLELDKELLEAENERLKSEDYMRQKMRPLHLEGDAAISFGLALELSEAKQEIEQLKSENKRLCKKLKKIEWTLATEKLPELNEVYETVIHIDDEDELSYILFSNNKWEDKYGNDRTNNVIKWRLISN